MKSKQFIQAIALALSTLSSADAATQINQHRTDLVAKCDSLIRTPADFTKDDHTFRRADACILGEEPWKAVMHGLALHDIDPATIGMYRGGFMAMQIDRYLTEQATACEKGGFNERQYFFAMALAVQRVERFMDRHGWKDAFEKDQAIQASLLAARTGVKDQVLPTLDEAVALAAEADDILSSEQINFTSRRNRFIGVQRHLSHNRDNLEKMAAFMATYFDGKKYAHFNDQMAVILDAKLPKQAAGDNAKKGQDNLHRNRTIGEILAA